MKIHILHNLREEPWGGGNQFLKALRGEWIRQGVYASTPDEADAILINSYPFGAEGLFDRLWRLKYRHPDKVVIYRLDGPISLIRQKDRDVDRIIRVWNDLIADGIIFQSVWCQEQNRHTCGITSPYQTVIHNAPDPTIFHPSSLPALPALPTLPALPSKLIATSWSSNPRKGFDIYKFLDEHLDFTRYDMTFVGNSPIEFKHIKIMKPVSSQELCAILGTHNIFITASKADPCSNSLIEALTCGLPAVARNDGGHPELVQTGGELFEGTHDVLEKIDLVANNLAYYRTRLPVFDLREVARRYQAFAQQIFDDAQAARYVPKCANRLGLLKLKKMVFEWKTKNVCKRLIGSFS